MGIDKKQNKILDSLVCQRIRDDSINLELIKQFKHSKGEAIITYMQQEGWKEDETGTIAYYIVKTQENTPLMFFALKCGCLITPLNKEENRLFDESEVLIYQALVNIVNEKEKNEKNLAKIDEVVKKYAEFNRLTLNEALDEIKDVSKYKNFIDFLKMFESEKSSERNDKITRVEKTYSGIELFHFCLNEEFKNYLANFGITRTLGEVVFWKFIVPKILKATEYVGCEYTYLFAADMSADEKLINYYKYSLKFDDETDLGTIKPMYDFNCKFMKQSIMDLKNNKEKFFNKFNDNDLIDIN